MNNRTYSTPKGQTVKNDSAVTQAAKTETNVKYVGLQKPNDVNIELEAKLQEIEMKTEELINLYNGGINVSTAGQTSVVNEYGADRETDTDENEAVSNVKVYNRQLYRGSKNETGSKGGTVESKEQITMRPTLPYYYQYETTAQETEGGQPTGGTGRMRLAFNSYKYPVKMSGNNRKYCQAMIVGTGRIDCTSVAEIDKLAFSFPSFFGTGNPVVIDPEYGIQDNIREWNTGTVSIWYSSIESDFDNWVTLYDGAGLPVLVDLGPHFDQIAYYPGGVFAFPKATHRKTSTFNGYVCFDFVIQGHVLESAFGTYGWDGCTIADDRVDPMGVWT